MFLRSHTRKKNGKEHRYWNVIKSRRLPDGRSAQRQVLYLGEINDSQEQAWRKTLAVFDEEKDQPGQACLVPDDRPIPADEVNALPLMMSDIRLLRPRAFGDCWHRAGTTGGELGPDQFWHRQLDDERGGVPWEKVLQLLAINRLCRPGSEFAVHRSGSSGTGARWMNCSIAILPWRRRIVCIAALIACSSTRTRCASI